MTTLHVRSVPDDLYQWLQRLAQARNRSLSAQVIMMLTQAAEDEERRKDQEKILKRIRRRRFAPSAKSPSSLDLLREDRSR
ncbi:MAG: FitA-like ribbon-helix-helix domain-containing protein [Chloroflexota bacterium]